MSLFLVAGLVIIALLVALRDARLTAHGERVWKDYYYGELQKLRRDGRE
jgi:N-glycosylase/DNA lyase